MFNWRSLLRFSGWRRLFERSESTAYKKQRLARFQLLQRKRLLDAFGLGHAEELAETEPECELLHTAAFEPNESDSPAIADMDSPHLAEPISAAPIPSNQTDNDFTLATAESGQFFSGSADGSYSGSGSISYDSGSGLSGGGSISYDSGSGSISYDSGSGLSGSGSFSYDSGSGSLGQRQYQLRLGQRSLGQRQYQLRLGQRSLGRRQHQLRLGQRLSRAAAASATTPAAVSRAAAASATTRAAASSALTPAAACR